MPDVAVKICGVTTAEDIMACAKAGARYIGFNFFPKSPRYMPPAQAAAVAADVPMGMAKVGLVVNATDAELDHLTQIVPIDMLQLHGAETPERVMQIKARYGLPIMKVVGIAGADDLAKIDLYSGVADQILIDAKAPKDAILPGGNGLSFDWRLLDGRRWPLPWMLAGGLTPTNVGEAIRRTGATQVDVASGVEAAPGVKTAELIKAFCDAARSD
ncbi:MAG: phosphoribosylanthranilate isomerase [Loktanella sp.]|nr:phosphoribosylanthranilate isomerase [Loktanella sp.]